MATIYGLAFDQESGSSEDWLAFYLLGTDKVELYSSERQRDERYNFLEKLFAHLKPAGFEFGVEKFDQEIGGVEVTEIPSCVSDAISDEYEPIQVLDSTNGDYAFSMEKYENEEEQPTPTPFTEIPDSDSPAFFKEFIESPELEAIIERMVRSSMHSTLNQIRSDFNG